MHVLLTGATGYIGSALLARLGLEHEVITAGRRSPSGAASHFLISDISSSTDWRVGLKGVDVIVHCAGHAHAGNEKSGLTLNRTVNVDGTVQLARQAAESGVRRFVFISSIGVNGNASRRPFCADDPPSPVDAYAVSKYEAERALWSLGAEFPLEIVVVRPPLVYGADAPGNFGRLMRAVQRGTPLPLGAVDNKRSFVGLDNLVDMIVRCAELPSAANHVFLAADGEDLSTTDFLRRLGSALGRPARLIPIPVPVLEAAASLLGRRDTIRKLCCDLQIDLTKTREVLGWHPPISVDEGLWRSGQGKRMGVR